MKKHLTLIGMVIGIPVFGLLVGLYIKYDFDKNWAEVVASKIGATEANSPNWSLANFCADPATASNSACQTYQHINWLLQGSIVGIAAGILLLVFITVSARLATRNRNLLLHIFSPGIKVVLIALFCLTILQGAIATYGAYMLESFAIQRVHYFLIGGIGLGALIGAFVMVAQGFSISKRVSSNVLGRLLPENEEPELWGLVRDIATRLGATPPQNIVVGLEPNFYATSADVVIYPGAEKQPNETLYLSLPLMRILSTDELTAVIGHELGHFRGDDTKFSLGFYPIYVGTHQAIVALQAQGNDDSRSIALIPAMAVLSFFMEQFASAERTIGREREIQADKAGVSVSSNNALALALLKIGAFAPLWESIRSAIVDALNEGKSYTNACSLYADVAATTGKPEMMDEATAATTVHPTDTHPPTSERIKSMGLSIDDLREKALIIDVESSSTSLLANQSQLEEELTLIEHRFMLEAGWARLPDEAPVQAEEQIA